MTQTAQDERMLGALATVTGLGALLSEGTKEDFLELGLDIVRSVLLEALVTIQKYDGSNPSLVEGRKQYLKIIPDFKSFYPNIEEDLQKRA
jgi:hypothetical protein